MGVFSVLARAGQRDAAEAKKAFEQARRSLNLGQGRLRRAEGNGLAALDDALAALEEAAPRVKRQILQAAVACITADDTVTPTEAELLRALSASLGCPMPRSCSRDRRVGSSQDCATSAHRVTLVEARKRCVSERGTSI